MAPMPRNICDLIRSFGSDFDMTVGFIHERIRILYGEAKYNTVKQTLHRLVKKGILIMDELPGEPNIYRIMPSTKLPGFDEFFAWMLKDPSMLKHMSIRDGGTNTGGGYKYLFRKMYYSMDEMLNQ